MATYTIWYRLYKHCLIFRFYNFNIESLYNYELNFLGEESIKICLNSNLIKDEINIEFLKRYYTFSIKKYNKYKSKSVSHIDNYKPLIKSLNFCSNRIENIIEYEDLK